MMNDTFPMTSAAEWMRMEACHVQRVRPLTEWEMLESIWGKPGSALEDPLRPQPQRTNLLPNPLRGVYGPNPTGPLGCKHSWAWSAPSQAPLDIWGRSRSLVARLEKLGYLAFRDSWAWTESQQEILLNNLIEGSRYPKDRGLPVVEFYMGW